MPFVLDNSVTMAWCFEDETAPLAIRSLDRLNADRALVPAVWPMEVANALLTAERRQRLQPAGVTRFLDLLQTLPIVVDSIDLTYALGAVLPVARAYSLKSYDASYLDLAMREGLPLATLDGPLREAARCAGVALVD